MSKYLLPLSLSIVILMQALPAYSASMSFQVSVIMPEHVMANADPSSSLFSNSSNQLVQTQTIIRNNQMIKLTTIVVA